MHKSIWICIEKGENNCSAYAPEVPGCMATDKTVEATKTRMTRALESHIQLMLEEGDSIEGITGAFPSEEAEPDDYFCLVHVEVSPEVPAGV